MAAVAVRRHGTLDSAFKKKMGTTEQRLAACAVVTWGNSSSCTGHTVVRHLMDVVRGPPSLSCVGGGTATRLSMHVAIRVFLRGALPPQTSGCLCPAVPGTPAGRRLRLHKSRAQRLPTPCCPAFRRRPSSSYCPRWRASAPRWAVQGRMSLPSWGACGEPCRGPSCSWA